MRRARAKRHVQSRRGTLLLRLAVVGIAILALSLRPGSAAQAASFTVSTCNASDLIAQINAAMTAGSGNVVDLHAGCTYTLTTPNNGVDGANGLPDVTTALTISGHGATITRGSGASQFRIFHISAAGDLSLDSVTITNGHAPDGVSGANGINAPDGFNGGNGGAGGTGAAGGAIYNRGMLTLTNSTLSGNSAGAGGRGGDGGIGGNGSNGAAGSPGSDGGPFGNGGAGSAGGNGGFGGAGGAGGAGGNGGAGGAIYNLGTASLTNSTLGSNRAGDGGSGGSGGRGGTGGTGGAGGAGGGGGFNGGDGGAGGNGGDGGHGGFGGQGGSGGNGGGIANQGTLSIANGTVSGNQTGRGGSGAPGGNGGFGGNGGPGGPGGGHGVFGSPGANGPNGSAGSQGAFGPSGPSGPDGLGGGLSGSATARNTILAGNSAGGSGTDCAGTVTSQDYNLIQSTSGCTLTGPSPSHDITGQDPHLGPLQDNGGPTFTMADDVNATQPAVDAIPIANCVDQNGTTLNSDQRGFTRPDETETTCDIGAYESGATAPKANQTISFGPLVDQTLGTPDFAVSATASSGLPVTFSSTTPTICSVSADGSAVHLLNVGTCTLEASQAGNASYNPAAPVDQSFAVTVTTGGGGGGGGTATPELGSGELVAAGLLPIALVLLRRKRARRHTRQSPDQLVG